MRWRYCCRWGSWSRSRSSFSFNGSNSDPLGMGRSRSGWWFVESLQSLIEWFEFRWR